nr:unnamed protein product [Digitaria exilis]
MAERDPMLDEPPAKRREVDPIAPTKHPWNLPAGIDLPHCSCNPEESYVAIPREANLPIDAEARSAVARVSLAVIAVASIDADGDQLWKASGFIVEFDEASMVGTIFSSATVANMTCCSRRLRSTERWTAFFNLCQEMQKATFLNTYTAIGGPAINRNGRVIGMLFQSVTCTPFLPANIIIRWWEHFKNTGNYCRPTIRVLGVNLHNAQSSPWVDVPTTLHEGLDGLLVELVFPMHRKQL